MTLRASLPLHRAVLLFWCLLALAAPLLPLDPSRIHLDGMLTPPSPTAWLGYDELGRDVLHRLILGARLSLGIALAVVALSATLGIAIGVVTGYLGGWVDLVVVRVIDIFLAFPGLLLAIALAGVLGPGADNVMIALAAVGWVGFARLARAQVLALKESDHVLAAKALGSSFGVIAMRHLLPLIAAPLLVEGAFALSGAVLAEAGLSFLGLGVQPPTPSWGSMIRDGARYMLVAPHYVLAPGIALSTVILFINLEGDRMRDRLDVRTGDRL